MLARDATPAVNRSSLSSRQSSSISTAWIASTINPVRIHAGASLNSSRLAREASRQITA